MTTQADANMETLVTALYGLTNQLAEDAKRNASTRTRTKRTLPDIKSIHSSRPYRYRQVL